MWSDLVIEHGGATSDFNTDMLIDYSTKYGVIILANSRNDLVANASYKMRYIQYTSKPKQVE
jgi:hypothetical protein